MKRVSKVLILVLLGVMLLTPALEAKTTEKYDIVINGGSLGAVSAALEAARLNPSAQVLLIEPTDWLGGQATSQGVATIDYPWHGPAESLIKNHPDQYLAEDWQQFLEKIKEAPQEAPGYGYGGEGCSWVSRVAFDPRTGAWALEKMTDQYSNLTVKKMTVVKEVTTKSVNDAYGTGKKITGLKLVTRQTKDDYKPFDQFLSETVRDWYSTGDSQRFKKKIVNIRPKNEDKGMQVVDASPFGDVIVLSGAKYTVGREKQTEKIGTDGSLPAMDQQGTQSFTFPFCVRGKSKHSKDDYLKKDFTNFDQYYQRKKSHFSLDDHSWEKVWTYRRLRNVGKPWQFKSPNKDDISAQNWNPGNDYEGGSLYKTKSEAQQEAANWQGGLQLNHIRRAEKQAVAFYYYLKETNPMSFDIHYLRGNHPDNMMATGKGVSKLPYLRGTRRIVGLSNFRITERFLKTEGNTSYRFYDSVGIGNYALDVHPPKNSHGIKPSLTKPLPFYIPYRALGSHNVRNLLAGGKNYATTYLTNAAYRVHPIEWAAGSAAGAAAALMEGYNYTNYELLKPKNLTKLQKAVKKNSPISWAKYDSTALPDKKADVIINQFAKVNKLTSVPVEVFQPTAVTVKIYTGNKQLGVKRQKTNGRFKLNIDFPKQVNQIRIDCYNSAGEKIAELDKKINWAGNIDNDGGQDGNDGSDQDDDNNNDDNNDGGSHDGDNGNDDNNDGDSHDDGNNPPNINYSKVVMNSSPGFSIIGSWTQGRHSYNGYTYRYSYSTKSLFRKAKWKFNIPQTGYYRVYTWYRAGSNRASDAPFTIHHAQGTTTVEVDQTKYNYRWVNLGKYKFTRGQTQVTLTPEISSNSDVVIAEMVKIKSIR